MKKELSSLRVGMLFGSTPVKKAVMESSQYKLKLELPYNSAIPLWGIYLQDIKISFKRNVHHYSLPHLVQ